MVRGAGTAGRVSRAGPRKAPVKGNLARPVLHIHRCTPPQRLQAGQSGNLKFALAHILSAAYNDMETGKEQSVETERISDYARLLRIIAHPTRLMILAELLKGMKCVNDIRDLLDVPQPNVSQHLAVLKENGLVASRKEGVSRCYRLARPRFIKDLLTNLRRERAETLPSGPGSRRLSRAKVTRLPKPGNKVAGQGSHAG